MTDINAISITARNIVVARHIEELLIEFKRENIEIILLKGAAFIFMFDECMVRRPMSDVDILVKSRDIKKSQLLIEKNGYRFVPGNSGWVYAKEGVLDVFLDLHSKLFYMSENEIWEKSQNIKAGGNEIKILSPEHNIVYLAYHMGAQHGSINKKWLKDIDLVIRNSKNLNWNEVSSHANKYGLKEVLYYAILKTVETCQTPVKGEWLNILSPSRNIKSLILKKLFLSNTGGPFMGYFLEIIVHPAHLLRIFPSPDFMKKRYKTSGIFIFIFYVYRPVELAFKGLRGFFNFLNVR